MILLNAPLIFNCNFCEIFSSCERHKEKLNRLKIVCSLSLSLSSPAGVFEDGGSSANQEGWGDLQHVRSDGQLAAAAHVRLHRAFSHQHQRHGRRPRDRSV